MGGRRRGGRAGGRGHVELRPKMGRARPLAERSVGTPDAGAYSLAMCLTVAGPALA